jgi:hypothetical protein
VRLALGADRQGVGILDRQNLWGAGNFGGSRSDCFFQDGEVRQMDEDKHVVATFL